MDRETRFQAELDEIDQAVVEGRIDENGALALREGAMASYDHTGYPWWKVLIGAVAAVAVLMVVLWIVKLLVA